MSFSPERNACLLSKISNILENTRKYKEEDQKPHHEEILHLPMRRFRAIFLRPWDVWAPLLGEHSGGAMTWVPHSSWLVPQFPQAAGTEHRTRGRLGGVRSGASSLGFLARALLVAVSLRGLSSECACQRREILCLLPWDLGSHRGGPTILASSKPK